MNALLRLLRIAPDPEPDLTFDSPARPHVAGRGSGEAVGPKLAMVRETVLDEATRRYFGLPAFDAEYEADPNPPMAGLTDSTPIFDAVMAANGWSTTDDHPLHHQFEVSLYLDVSESAELQEGAAFDRRVVEAADHGWGWPS